MMRSLKKHYSHFCLIILFSLSFNIAKAQTWLPVGNGMEGGYVYSLNAYDSVLYAGGTFIGPGNHIAQWDGNNWSGVGSGINGNVYSMFHYKNLLYTGGWFTNAGGYSAGSLAQWNGSNWSAVSPGYLWNVVSSIDTFNNNMFAASPHYGIIGWWNGKIWQNIGPLNAAYANTIVNYKGELYIGGYEHGFGYFAPVTGCLFQLDYKTQLWKRVGTYTGKAGIANVLSLCVYNNNLYVGGTYDSVNGMPANGLTMWNGDSITVINPGINGTVSAMTVFDNALYIGGIFDSAGGMSAHNIACWNDMNWSALGSGVNNQVFAMTSFNGELYVGGGFTSPYNYIAKYDPPIERTFNGNGLVLFPNPNYGKFTLASENIIAGSQLQIYNAIGQNICNMTLNSTTTTISILGCSNGVYLYRIVSPGKEKIATGKFIVL